MRGTLFNGVSKALTLTVALATLTMAPNVFANGGMQYHGWTNLFCRGKSVAQANSLNYFSKVIQSYIDAQNPGNGCQQMPYYP